MLIKILKNCTFIFVDLYVHGDRGWLGLFGYQPRINLIIIVNILRNISGTVTDLKKNCICTKFSVFTGISGLLTSCDCSYRP